MAFQIKKAARTSKRVRVAIDGPSGSGKTFSLLRLAFTLKQGGLCKKILVIDTENNSSELYAGEAPDGYPWEFEVLGLDSYSPKTYMQAIQVAVKAGYDCLIIDSLSHEWMGKDGALDMADKKGGRFEAWKDVTPLHRQLIEDIIRCPAHVLASMRTKTDYIVEDTVNKHGNTVKAPRKLGMAPIQREGMEYEFTLYGTMDLEHLIKITKSRCSAMQDAVCPKPDPAFWQPLVDWLNGAAAETPPPITTEAAVAAACERLNAVAFPPTTQAVQFADDTPATITTEQLQFFRERLGGEWAPMQGFLDAFEIAAPEALPQSRRDEAASALQLICEIEGAALEKGVTLEEVLGKCGKPASLFSLDDEMLTRIRNGIQKAAPRVIPA